jgi:ribonuclease J
LLKQPDSSSIFDAPPAESTTLDVIPLGGVEEIGLNCTAFVYGQDVIVVDAGLKFPESTHLPGVDLVVPDFTFLKESSLRLRGLILTHGHEDHIGALAFFLQTVEGPLTVYGTALTLAMAMGRLEEYDVVAPKTQEIKPRDKLSLGPFDVEFIGVNHSILAGVGLAISTPVGVVIHTGDFKIDYCAPEAEQTDLYSFARYGEQGVLALLSDSTNADVPGFCKSEVEVGAALTDIFQKAPGRIILACFSSSLARIRQVALAAKVSDRKILFDGRSMRETVSLGHLHNFLDIDVRDYVTMEEAADYDDRSLAIVVTGSQGEPLSALSRMALGEHKFLSVQKGDTVIFSARVIPGNERAISAVINQFYSKGAIVVDNRLQSVHASGHGQAEELKLMLSLTKPKHLIPIHGEPRQLAAHASLARLTGMADNQIKILSNGQRLMFGHDGSASLGQRVPTGRMLVDGNRLGQSGDPVIRGRLKMAEQGLVYVVIVLDPQSFEPVAPIAVKMAGVLFENDSDLVEAAHRTTAKCLKDWKLQAGGHVPQVENLLEALKRELRSLFKHSIRSRPIICPEVLFMKQDGSLTNCADDSNGEISG